MSSGPKPRRIGHSYTGKGKAPEPTRKIFEITCIDYADPCDFTDKDGNIPTVIPSYTLGKEEELFSGTVELVSNDRESLIRSKLVDVLNTRIPGILTSDFSFVKVARKTVSEPACQLDQNWDYPQLKILAGQGKICIRLRRFVEQITGKPTSKPCTNIKSYFEDLPDHLPAHSPTLEDVVPATHTSASIVPSTSLQSTTTVMPGSSQVKRNVNL